MKGPNPKPEGLTGKIVSAIKEHPIKAAASIPLFYAAGGIIYTGLRATDSKLPGTPSERAVKAFNEVYSEPAMRAYEVISNFADKIF